MIDQHEKVLLKCLVSQKLVDNDVITRYAEVIKFIQPEIQNKIVDKLEKLKNKCTQTIKNNVDNNKEFIEQKDLLSKYIYLLKNIN